MESKDFGEYLKKLRKEKKLTIRQLELYSKVSNAYISQMERGDRGVPSPDILKKLAKPLGVEYEELMEKAGYITKEEVFKTALSDGYLDEYKGYETDDEILKQTIIRIFEDPDKLFKDAGSEATDGFLNYMFSHEESKDFWNKMSEIALAKKGIDTEKTKEILEELENLSSSDIDDVIDFMRYKQSKKER